MLLSIIVWKILKCFNKKNISKYKYKYNSKYTSLVGLGISGCDDCLLLFQSGSITDLLLLICWLVVLGWVLGAFVGTVVLLLVACLTGGVVGIACGGVINFLGAVDVGTLGLFSAGAFWPGSWMKDGITVNSKMAPLKWESTGVLDFEGHRCRDKNESNYWEMERQLYFLFSNNHYQIVFLNLSGFRLVWANCFSILGLA